jgi:RND family efflux transporter MFP subunit
MVVLSSCGHKDQKTADAPVVDLPVAVAAQATLQSDTMASGTVEADDRVQLVARVPGLVRASGLYEGQPVRRGQVVATIDARQADAAVQRARSALDAAQAEHRKAAEDLVRDAPLAESGALAADAYQQGQLRSQVAAAGVRQAQAALSAAETDRSYMTIISPIDGVVVARHLRDGDMAMPGAPIATVEGRGRLIFRFAAPPESLTAFAPGRTVPVLLDGREDRPVEGRVRSIVPSADPATRRHTVEILLPADVGITSGMFGRIQMPADNSRSHVQNAVSVPAFAVVERGGLTGVYVVGSDRRITFRWVRLGESVGDRSVIVSGLSAGERVLARVDASVRDGARLKGGASR